MLGWLKRQVGTTETTAGGISAAITILIIGTVLGVVGCGGSSSGESSPTTSAGKTSSQEATQTVIPQTPELIGFGATPASWDANHQADDRFLAGSVYDPDPSLARGGDQRFNGKYYGVVHDDPIISYEMRFPPGTGIEGAKQSVLSSEFPDDAKIVWFKRLDTCAQMIIRSKAVADAIDSAALIEFSSGAGGDQYDPQDVWSAILMPIELTASTSGFGC